MSPKTKGKRGKDGSGSEERLKRERLFREIKLSTLSSERSRGLWREALARIKIPDIVRKVEIAWQTLEHATDLKDYSISLLLDCLQDAENQRRKANGAHVEVIERSIRAHRHRLRLLRTLFYGSIETALADKADEFESIAYYRATGETALRKIDSLVNDRSENASNVARSTAFSKIDTFVEDGKNERRMVTTHLQMKLENLWNDLRNVFTDYRKSTEARRKACEIVRRKDEMDQQTIARQYLRTAALLEEIGKCREKIHSYTNETAIELQEILRESNFFHDIYRETNDRFVSGRKRDKGKTTTMSNEYNRTVNNLERLVTKAERILILMQMCGKYETQDEKILPTIDEHPVAPPRAENDVLCLKTAVGDFQTSINFWRRLGFARLIATELRIERDRLTTRASVLRESIKNSLSDEVELAHESYR